MKSTNLCVAATVLSIVAVSFPVQAQDRSRASVRITGTVPDICRAPARSAVVEGDRLILTIDRLCNRAHVLTVAALDGDAVRIIESRTGRSTTDAVGRFVAPTPLHGPETVVIHFDGADPARVANANIRISVAPLAA